MAQNLFEISPPWSKIRPTWLQKRSQIDTDGLWCPFRAQIAPMAATGCPASDLVPAFLEVSGRDGVAQGAFLENPGFPKWTQNGHEEARSAPWSAKMGENDRPEGGPEMGTKNGLKKCMKQICVWIRKTFKSVVRSQKIKVFSFSEKA